MTNMLNQSAGRKRLTKTKLAILASLIAGAMVVPFIMPAQKAHALNQKPQPMRPNLFIYSGAI